MTESIAGENTSGKGKGAAIPQEIRGWNWGAFLLSWIWGIGNSIWIALFALILGPIMAIVLGVKGNEWAWRNKKWNSVEHFKKTQRVWTWVGVVFICGYLVLVVLVTWWVVVSFGQMWLYFRIHHLAIRSCFGSFLIISYLALWLVLK